MVSEIKFSKYSAIIEPKERLSTSRYIYEI